VAWLLVAALELLLMASDDAWSPLLLATTTDPLDPPPDVLPGEWTGSGDDVCGHPTSAIPRTTVVHAFPCARATLTLALRHPAQVMTRLTC
jgi:hypothetical protein